MRDLHSLEADNYGSKVRKAKATRAGKDDQGVELAVALPKYQN